MPFHRAPTPRPTIFGRGRARNRTAYAPASGCRPRTLARIVGRHELEGPPSRGRVTVTVDAYPPNLMVRPL